MSESEDMTSDLPVPDDGSTATGGSTSDGGSRSEPPDASSPTAVDPSSGIGALQVATIALLSGLIGLVLGFGLAGAGGDGGGPSTEGGSDRTVVSDRSGGAERGDPHGREGRRWGPPPWGGREGGSARSDWFDPDELRAWWDENVDLEELQRWFDEEVRPELRRRTDRRVEPPATTTPPAPGAESGD